MPETHQTGGSFWWNHFGTKKKVGQKVIQEILFQFATLSLQDILSLLLHDVEMFQLAKFQLRKKNEIHEIVF